MKEHACEQCVDLLADYLEGALDQRTAEELERHLGRCPPCVRFVGTYRATSRVCRQKLAVEMPQELSESLAAFLAARIPGFRL